MPEEGRPAPKGVDGLSGGANSQAAGRHMRSVHMARGEPRACRSL